MASRPHNQPQVYVTAEELLGYEIDGRYVIESMLGEGGMGVVFRTTQRSLNRPVALKLLRLDELDRGQRLERFRREIAIVGGLSHPNIVQVYDTGTDPELGLDYIAMELVEGLPLDELLRGRRAHPAFALEVVRQICAGLTEPHGRGIIHRDIKPGNILLSTRSDDRVQVKVVDFGIARAVMAEGDGRITTTGMVVGSPVYMAPEMTRGDAVDGRTDLYAVGVILFEMLTGRIPFDGNSPMAIMLQHAAQQPPSLLDVLPDFPHPGVAELVDDLLAKTAEERPRDARAALQRIDRLCATLDLPPVVVASDQPPGQALERWILEPAVDPMADTYTSGLPHMTGAPATHQLPTEILTAPMPEGGLPGGQQGSTQPWAGGAGTGARPLLRERASAADNSTAEIKVGASTSSTGWMIPASARLPARRGSGTDTVDPPGPPVAHRDATTKLLSILAAFLVVVTLVGGWWVVSTITGEPADAEETTAPEESAATTPPPREEIVVVPPTPVAPQPPAPEEPADDEPAVEEPAAEVVAAEETEEKEVDSAPSKPVEEELHKEKPREERPRQKKARPKPRPTPRKAREKATPAPEETKPSGEDDLQDSLEWLKDR